MLFENVCLESFGYCLPNEVISSDQIESRLQPLYSRLRLPEGRLELMTGIRERRFWPEGTLPSDKSIESGKRALEAAELSPADIGVLIHASVCRDHLEPATACRVHHGIGLPHDCCIYDVSNACLGLLNGALQIANMIELGQVSAGIVVGTESGRHLVETTIESLNENKSLTRNEIKTAVASLTIGSGSCAMVLTNDKLSKTKNRFRSAAVYANTKFHGLCQSGSDEAVAGGMQPMMATDSEQLMREGIATGVATFDRFLANSSGTDSKWSRQTINKTICHQVGSAHHRLMLESLKLDPANDFATYPWLGNTGSVALPTAMAIGAQQDHLTQGDNVAMLGIGSGINCIMIGCQWQETRVGGEIPSSEVAEA